jgi:hypothetical protein
MIGKTRVLHKITPKSGKVVMRVVFRPKDQTPGRDVAIKVLPEEFAKVLTALPVSSAKPNCRPQGTIPMLRPATIISKTEENSYED